MNVQITINWLQVATIFVLLIITIIQSVRINNIKDEIRMLEETTEYLERSIARLRNSRKHDNEEAKKLFKQLLDQLDKKLMPIEEVTHILYDFMGEEEEHTSIVGYEVADLTETEKAIRVLEKKIERVGGQEK